MLEISHKEGSGPKRKQWRGSFVLGFAMLLAALAGFWSWSGNQNDPIYEGKRLSDHLYDGYQPFMFPPGTTVNGQVLAKLEVARIQKRDDADAALRALGPRAVPLILAWMSESPKSLRLRLQRLGASNYSRWGWLMKSRWVSTRRELLAFDAATLIPQRCESLVPFLCQRTIDEPRHNTLGLLDRIVANVPLARRERILKDNWRIFEFALAEVSREGGGTFGNSILTELYKYLSPQDRELLLGRLMRVRDQPGVMATMRVVDPSGALRHLAYLENEPTYRKMLAARFFIEKPLMADLVVPALAKTLEADDVALVKDACRALASYGANARAALPALRTCRQAGEVAMAASNAIARIENAQGVSSKAP